MNSLQVGSTVTFNDPSEKLKTKRVAGEIVELVHHGKDARVRVKDTNRTITVRCELLRNDGVQDEVGTMSYVWLR